MRKLIFLGTGHGLPKRSAATSILLKTDKTNLLIDCAGGHEIIGRLFQSGNNPGSLKNIFISHYDSDHILGIVPLIRVIRKIDHKVNLICSQTTYEAIESLFKIVANKHWIVARDKLNVIIVKDKDKLNIEDLNLEFVDTGDKTPMFGVKVTFNDQFTVFYPGDEPIYRRYFARIENIDLLIHEAFCLEKDVEKYDPHGKCHSTAKEAGENAKKVKAKKLALFHMEDDTLESRKQEYTKEIASVFNGKIFVPVDLDEVEI